MRSILTDEKCMLNMQMLSFGKIEMDVCYLKNKKSDDVENIIYSNGAYT